MKLYAHWKNKRWEFDIDREGEWIILRCGRERLELRFEDSTRAIRSMLFDSRKLDFGWTRKGGRYQIVMDGAPYEIEVKDARSEQLDSIREASGGPSGARITAPIPGLVRRVLVKEGDRVRKGQPLLTLDAMKMENEICSPADGVVSDLTAAEGRSVNKDQLLMNIGAS